MAITSFGYDGTITESQFAQGVRHIGSARYGVAGPGDWRVTVAGGTRTVSIAAGSGWGPGVFDVSDAPETLSMDAAPSGQQWNLVVARRDWDTNTTSFEVVTGGSAMTIPGGRESTDGVVDDQPLAFVRVDTSTSIQEIVDARVWPGAGGLVARNDSVLQYMDEPGSSVLINGARWTRSVNSGYGLEWVKESVLDSGWVNCAIATHNKFASVPAYPAQVRKVGNRVDLRGGVQVQSGGDPANVMVTVPAGFRPAGNFLLGGFKASTGTLTGVLHVNALGYVQTVYAAGVTAVGSFIPLFGSWYVD